MNNGQPFIIYLNRYSRSSAFRWLSRIIGLTAKGFKLNSFNPMKTPIKLTVSALFLTLSLLSSLPGQSQNEYYTEKPFAAVMYPAQADSKLWLCLEHYKPGEKVCIELINQKGQVLFDETISGKPKKRNAYRQSFDMNQLGDGTYTFLISAGGHKEEFTFKLSTPALQQTIPARLIAVN